MNITVRLAGHVWSGTLVVQEYKNGGHVIIPICYLSPMILAYIHEDKQIQAEEDLIQSQQEQFELNKEHYCDPEYGCD